MQRRGHARDESRHQRGDPRDCEHTPIDADCGDACEAVGQGGRQRAHTHPGRSQTDEGAQCRHEKTLEQVRRQLRRPLLQFAVQYARVVRC